MTRDEAIKAMQKGKKVRHSSFEHGSILYMNNKGGVIFKDSIETRISLDNYWFSKEEFNDSWEIVKTKTKKTFWIALSKDFSSVPISNVTLYANREQAERAYPPHYGNQHIPVEIEVEE